MSEPEENSLENIFRRCGDFHRFQLIHYICLSVLTVCSGATGFYYVFGLAEPNFRCQLPTNVWPDDHEYEPLNATYRSYIDAYQLTPLKCDINGTTCSHFVFDRSIYGLTFTEEAQFVCNNELKKTWLSTAYQIGTLTILIVGPMGDRFGRRKMIQGLTIGIFFATVTTQLFLQFMSMSSNAKFIVLFINQAASAIDPYSMAFLLVMELTSSSHTSFAGGLVLTSYTIGEVIFITFAYFTRHWLNLKWLTSAYFGVMLFYLYFVPESPYWLDSRKKYAELETYLRKVAKINKKSEENWLPQFQQFVQERQQSKENVVNEKRTKKSKLIRFIPRLCLCGTIEFVTMLLYTKIAYDLGEANETISPYWNFVIGAALEAIGYLTASFLISTRWGRKRSLITFALITAASVLTIPFITERSPLAATIVSQIGKLSISGAVCVSWVYVPELFPTFMRGLANAVLVFVGSFGSMIAPIVDSAVSKKQEKITFYIYAGLTVLLAGIISTLPETRERSFDDGEERHDTTQTDAIEGQNDSTQTEDTLETKF